MRNLVVGLMVLLFVFTGVADTDELAELKKQLTKQQQMIEQQQKLMEQMMARIEQLEAQNRAQEQQIDAKITKAVEDKQISALPDNLKWIEKVKISGDLRYRHENIDTESSGRWAKGRTRHRIRARLMLEAMINGDWDAIFRLASGTSDPTSTNVTLDDGFSSKEIRLDLAYFDWHPSSVPGLNVYGGKMKFPLYKAGGSQLIWDGDLNPEGIAVNYKIPLDGDNRNTAHINGGAFWAEESSSGADQSLWAVQSYLRHNFNSNSSDYLLGGASYYCYGNLKGQKTIYSQDPADMAFGNSFTTIGGQTHYVSDYDLLEFFGEYGTKIRNMPVSLFGNYVKNLVASTDEDTGWLIGVKLNKARQAGSWQFGYDYRQLDSDAVLGVFSDSDFAGGITDSKGHRFSFAYQLAKNLQAALTYFVNERSDDDDYRRLQADLKLKF